MRYYLSLHYGNGHVSTTWVTIWAPHTPAAEDQAIEWGMDYGTKLFPEFDLTTVIIDEVVKAGK